MILEKLKKLANVRGIHMTLEKLIEEMKRLAQGEFEIDEWEEWWRNNSYSVERLINRGGYLKIKPIKHEFKWLAIFKSQQGAMEFLEKNNIPFKPSERYEKNYQKEFSEFFEAEENKRKEKNKKLKESCPELFKAYPKFSASLNKVFSDGDILEKGASEKEIKIVESNIGIKLPEDITEFFKVISLISLEGIHISLKELDFQEEYLILGDYWKEADGDKLLLKLPVSEENNKIFYYSHEENKVRFLCKSINELMEKEFARYNREI
jgi:hypothetical protein